VGGGVRITGHGLAIDLPPGWEGVIYRREGGYPVLHAGDFTLPAGDGDFGIKAIRDMSPAGAFAAMTEYDPAIGGRGLFSELDTPWPLRPTDPSPRAMQRTVGGRAGVQRFFTAKGRPFCLYLVVGTAGGTAGPVARANRVLSTIRIAPREA
jgi:hypothetical protein